MPQETITLKLVAQDLASGNIAKAVAGLDKLAHQSTLSGWAVRGMAMQFGFMLNPAILVSKAIGQVTDFIGGAVDAAKRFEDQMATVNTIAHLSEEALAALGNEVQTLAVRRGRTTEDLTQGLYDLHSAGIATADAMGVLEDATTLSIGSLSTTAEAVDLLTSTLNAYRFEAEESERVTDIWAKSVEIGKVTAADLAASVSLVIPVAAAAGVELEEVAASMALLSSRGSEAGEVAVYMRQAVAALIKPTRELNALQKQTGLNFAEIMRNEGLVAALQRMREEVNGDVGAMGKMLGRVQALSYAVSVTGDNFGEFNETLGEMSTPGAALDQMNERTDTLAFQQGRLNAAIETFNQDLGQDFVGLLADAAGFIADITSPPADPIQKFRSWADGLVAVGDEMQKTGLSAREMGYDLGFLEDAMADTPLGLIDPAFAESVHIWREIGEGARAAGLTHTAFQNVLEDLKSGLGLTTDEARKLIEEWILEQRVVKGLEILYGRMGEAQEEAAASGKDFRKQIVLSEEELKALPGVINNVADALAGDDGLADSFKAAQKEAQRIAGGPDSVEQQFKKARREVAYWEKLQNRAIKTNQKDLYALATAHLNLSIARFGDLQLMRRAFRVEQQELAETQAQQKARKAAIREVAREAGVSEKRVREELRKTGVSLTNVKDKLLALDKVDPNVTITVSANQALAAIQTVRDNIRGILNLAGVEVTAPQGGGSGGGGNARKTHDGGYLAPHETAIIRQDEAYLSAGPGGGNVVPLEKMGGGVHIHLEGAFITKGARDFVQEIGPELTRWQRAHA